MKSSSKVVRRIGAVVAGLSLVLTAAACGSSGSASQEGSGSAASGNLDYWTLQDATNDAQQAGVDAFNATSDTKVSLKVFEAKTFNDKVRAAMGSSAMPGMFFNYGGGSLDDYVKAGKLVDLSEAEAKNPDLTSAFLPAVMDIGKVDGKQVGIPVRGTQPVFIFYSKKVFADAGIQPPTTFDELQAAVTTLKGKGITPFALGGKDGWTELMWVEYLVDRIGGPEVFQKIASGDASGWKDPAVLQAATEIKGLVDSGAFGTNYGSVAFGSGGSSTLLSSGKAAMELMGSWDYAVLKGDSADFVSNDLGYVAFPAYTGGKGDPGDVVGNPTNYVSVTTAANKDVAFDFLKTTYSEEYVKGLIKDGEVPVTTNAADLLSGAPDPSYAQFQYDLVKNAPSFTQSWDQALGSTVGTPLVTEIQKLFNGQSTPEQFVSAASALS